MSDVEALYEAFRVKPEMGGNSGAYVKAVNFSTGVWGISSQSPEHKAKTRALYMTCHDEYIEGMRLWSLAYPEASRLFFESDICREMHQTIVDYPVMHWVKEEGCER